MSNFDLTPLRSALAEFIPQGRAGLLPALHTAQALYGYLPEPVTAEVARALRVPLADVHGVIEFYSMFYNEPVGKTIVRVCADPACAMRGADEVLEAAQRKANDDTTVERAPCLGLCNLGVAVNVTSGDRGLTYGNATPDSLDSIFALNAGEAADYVGGDLRLLTALCGNGRATTLAEYEAAGGMAALKKV
ncbi:MAG: NAD(P)H-dependent oxidoreductase subunit E, partial [Chloroflexota bacterium]